MKNILLLLTTLFASITMSATVHKVKASDGADVLKSTIAEAATGDTVLVQEGTFTGNFTMKEGVQVIGGWNGLFTSKKDYATILDANADGRVLNQTAAFAVSTIWENLTIQNGGATEALGDKGGFGVYLRGNGGLRHCLVQNNKFTGTSGESNGGGVRVDGADAKFVALEDCWIKGNQGTHAGGVCLGKGTMINCLVEENTTTNNATGGVTVQDGSFLLNSIIRNNNPKGDFGGVRMRSTTPSTVANCLIYGNVAGTEDAKKTVGGIGINDGQHYVYNNTIVDNIQTSTSNTSRCGMRINSGSPIQVHNNIIWGNKVNDVAQPYQIEITAGYYGNNKMQTCFTHNAFMGDTVTCSDTNIKLASANPGFVNTASGDYTLAVGSDLIDVGDNSYAQGAVDLAGNARISNTTVDLGAYEYQIPIIDNYVNVGEDLQAAIDATTAGSTVYVEAGTFTGNFTMKEGVQVSGGWDETFTTQTEYGTTLDANANGRVLNQPAAFSVLTVWSNFTIQNGKLTTALSDQGGAGVFLNKKGRVQDCLIQNNIVNTTITGTGNDNAMGGGVSCNSGNAEPDTVAYNCVIKNNSATHGGGVRVNGKGVVVYNCIIKDNQTTNNAAGGVHLHNGSKLINCIVRDNKANGDTGGVRLTGGNVSDIINCLIVGNEATGQVGGVAIEGNNKANFINNTVVGNKQNKSGATASLSGVKIKNDIGGSGTFFVNNIIWGNITGDTIAPQGVYYISKYDKDAGQRSYNAIIGQLGDDDTKTCIKLTADNPGFVSPENGDFRLVLSQLVEGGDKAKVVGAKDLAGNNRIINDHVDYGCYEYTGAATLLNEKEESEFDEGETDVVMRRSFVADGSYYTLALPFAMSQEQIATVFGACQISELESSILKSGTDTHMELRLDFAKVASIEANKPYLFLPQADVTNPVFEAVTLSKTANDVETDYADMKGILTPTTFDDLSDGTYFLGSGNVLQPLDETSNMVKAYRGYFVLHQKGEPAKTINKVVRAMVNVNNAPTAITMVAKQAQTKKMLINNQIVIMRNDNVYTVLGSQIY